VIDTIQLVVFGVAAPQGSKRHVGRGRMIESSNAVGPWRDRIAAEAQAWCLQHPDFAPLDEPIQIDLVFELPRPATSPKRVLYPAKKPDLDKLVRAVLDALTGIIYADDARVVALSATKRYAKGAPVVKVSIAPFGGSK